MVAARRDRRGRDVLVSNPIILLTELQNWFSTLRYLAQSFPDFQVFLILLNFVENQTKIGQTSKATYSTYSEALSNSGVVGSIRPSRPSPENWHDRTDSPQPLAHALWRSCCAAQLAGAQEAPQAECLILVEIQSKFGHLGCGIGCRVENLEHTIFLECAANTLPTFNLYAADIFCSEKV